MIKLRLRLEEIFEDDKPISAHVKVKVSMGDLRTALANCGGTLVANPFEYETGGETGEDQSFVEGINLGLDIKARGYVPDGQPMKVSKEQFESGDFDVILVLPIYPIIVAEVKNYEIIKEENK